MHFHIITLFPQMFDCYLHESILGRAVKNKHIRVSFYNPMDYSEESTYGSLPRRIDDKPYGGGPGMVMRAEPVMKAIQAAIGRKNNVSVVHFAPRSTYFTNEHAKQIATQSLQKKSAIKDIVFVCGRYEGIDSRITEMFPGMIFSIGDYVLTGGELPTMVMIDAIARQLPGVLGDSDSREEERTAAGKYYTRPETIQYKKKQYRVPDVLLSGDHKAIDLWRQENS